MQLTDMDNLRLGLDFGETHGAFDGLLNPKRPASKTKNRTTEKTGTDKSFPCPNCSSVYNRHDNLTQHLKYVCFQKPRFACPYCSYITKRTYNVYGHVRSKHPCAMVAYIDVEDSNNLVTPQNGR
jgi:uncharacterized C2H2 Zn-finger protein